ncbi:MAG: AmmeMemoRadiSam system radical SAM enzyme [Planctomycetota bacterium]
MEAAWYEKTTEGRTRCLLCPQGCVRGEGEAGLCLGRVTRGGVLYAETYARVASVAMDPIEKKPLYHFYPGRRILSMGTYGCNLRCSFCQNWNLSQQRAPTEELAVPEAMRLARRKQSIGLAYTYNEPIVWFEYVRDCAREARALGLKNVLVTNGYINEGPLEEILPWIDAMNIDIKSFRDAFYQKLCGARLKPVLEAAKRAASACHVEITNLVIPGHNDDPAEQEELAAWIAESLGPRTPVHLSAHFPRHRLRAAPTTAQDLEAARARFDKRLAFVYVGNLDLPGMGDTRCPGCGALVVERRGYSVALRALSPTGSCARCGEDLSIPC